MSKDLGDSIFSYNSDTNYDEATLRQQKDIEDEISASQPLIGPLEDLESLELEVSLDDVFLSKIQNLKRKYSHYRKIRGDGNCFYRAFGFACLEGLLKSKTEAEQLRTIIERSKDELVSLGYSECTVEDFQSMFLETIDAVVAGGSLDKLLESMNDRTTSDYIVVYLRLLVSSYLQRNSDFFMNFIEGSKSIRDFCVQEVEPMNRESDQIHIIALTSYSHVGVRIEYMDRSDAMTSHDFPEGCTPKMFLLYRPGHYDILYE